MQFSPTRGKIGAISAQTRKALETLAWTVPAGACPCQPANQRQEQRSYVRYPTSPAFRSPLAPDADRVRAQPVHLRDSQIVVVHAAAGRALRNAGPVRPIPGDPHRPVGGTPYTAQSEHHRGVAVRRPFHRAEDRPNPGRTGDPTAVHRHGGRGLQRRVVAGAEAGGVGPRVHRRVGGHPRAAPAARLGGYAVRHDLRHERGLQPGGHPAAAHGPLHGSDGGCVRRDRGDSSHSRRPVSPIYQSTNPPPPHPQRHPLDYARLPTRRDRAHRPIHAGRARPAYDRQAEPDLAGQRSRPGDPPSRPGVHRDRDPRLGLREGPGLRQGAGADPFTASRGREAGSGLRGQAQQHPGDAQSQDADARRRDVHVRPGALPGHHEPVR